MPPALSDEHVDGQRYALLRILRLLMRSGEGSVCIGMMPEGDEGNAAGLIEQHVAASLPKALRGKYADGRVTDGTLG